MITPEQRRRELLEESHRHNCKSKVAYPNRTIAVHAMAVKHFAYDNTPDLDVLDVYQCLSCGQYHIGHSYHLRFERLRKGESAA